MLEKTHEARHRAEQIEKYAALCALIAEAKKNGQSFSLKGARQIMLFIEQDEGRYREAFHLRRQRVPVYKQGGFLRLRVEAYERWVALQEYCATHGLDFGLEATKWGFPEPPGKKK